MALDYGENTKKSDDILDIMLRKKYEGTEGITFKSLCDLRNEIGETFLKTLKSFIDTNNGKKQVVIIDDLSLSYDDMVKIRVGQTSEMEETLAWLADNTAMTLAALSSTSLLDRLTGAAVCQTELNEMIKRTGFEAVCLKHIMRSSQNIAVATSTDSVSQALPGYKIQMSIPPGSSFTVPGARPRALIHKYNPGDVDHSKLARFVTQHLRTVNTERIKCVVLTDTGISPRKLSVELRQSGITRVSCFDGGVERFYYGGRPVYREGGAGDGGEAELTEWLRAEAGVLVTHGDQFRGCESDTVIFVTRDWGGCYGSRRSPVTRAVAGLTLVTSDFGISVSGLKENWDVEIVREGAGERDSDGDDDE